MTSTEISADRSSAAERSNLPAHRPPLIGRNEQAATVGQRLMEAEAGLLTLIGAGGCGKTCLAVDVAGRLLDAFPDGVWLVEFAPLSDPALVDQAVAAVLQVREGAGQTLRDSLLGVLRSRRLLLLLDNTDPELMARIFKTLADPTRLRLLGAMTLDCKSVSQLVEESGLSQPLVSHHLRILRKAGLAKSSRRGIHVLLNERSGGLADRPVVRQSRRNSGFARGGAREEGSHLMRCLTSPTCRILAGGGHFVATVPPALACGLRWSSEERLPRLN